MTSTTTSDQDVIQDITQRVTDDLAMITDREFQIEGVEAQRVEDKVVGEGQIHISFKLGFHVDGQVRHGCILVPLPDAISLASYLMMVPDEEVETLRQSSDLERESKEAMLEIGNFIAGAADAAARSCWEGDVSVRSEGCQGVAPGMRPNFVYQPGADLLVGRADVKLHTFESFRMTLMVPPAGS